MRRVPIQEALSAVTSLLKSIHLSYDSQVVYLHIASITSANNCTTFYHRSALVFVVVFKVEVMQ